MAMRFLALVLFLLTVCAVRAGEPDLLEPEKAFRFSAQLLDVNRVEVSYDIAPGYYLYREKLKFSADPATIRIDASQLPAGKVKMD